MSTDEFDAIRADVPPELISAVRIVMDAQPAGRENAISGARLVSYVNRQFVRPYISRKIRLAVHELRRRGMLICSAPGKAGGYYRPATFSETDEFCRRELHSKAMDLLETERAQREAARREFGRQMPLIVEPVREKHHCRNCDDWDEVESL